MVELKVATHRVAGGYDIHIAEAGSGPALVFLHGSGPGPLAHPIFGKIGPLL